MSKDRIKSAAIKLFSVKGYMGTSLEMIAHEIGLKKQSIYSHFKNKEELFLHIFQESLESELVNLERYFKQAAGMPLPDALYGLIMELKARYNKELSLHLILYFSFIIPDQLEEKINSMIGEFVQYKKTAILERLTNEQTVALRVDPNTAMIAYMNLLEGMLIEIVYGSSLNDYEQRLQCSWDIFWNGLIKR